MFSQMGHSQNNSLFDPQKIIMFLLMSVIDEITKNFPKVFNEIKTSVSNYFTRKVHENIIDRPKKLLDTSITLATRHDTSVFRMTRIYKKVGNSGSGNVSSDEDASEETNGIVDAVIAHVSKLNNIPILKLINNGQLMMIYKEKPIQVTPEIFLKIDKIEITPGGFVESVSLSLLSNTLSSAELASYVKKLYEDNLEQIKNSLGDKIYYFDQKNASSSNPPPLPSSSDPAIIRNHKMMLISTAPKQLGFTMTPFHSNKKFSNIYGDEVRLIEKRIKFFMENRKWYDLKGIPYQIGLLLSGMHGTGKTSIIRAIANYTKRHIVNVNFANITTATQLKNLFFSEKLQVFQENQFGDTKLIHIPVDQRIYVLEEIDTIGDIVKQRNGNEKNETINDELTLGEILTVLDGTMEIPGRIVIITSNHPEMLDKALIRPGRIDVNVKFGYAKKELIVEMYESYFDKKLSEKFYDVLPDRLLSPAEVGQILFKHFDDIDPQVIVDDLIATVTSLGRAPNNNHKKIDDSPLINLSNGPIDVSSKEDSIDNISTPPLVEQHDENKFSKSVEDQAESPSVYYNSTAYEYDKKWGTNMSEILSKGIQEIKNGNITPDAEEVKQKKKKKKSEFTDITEYDKKNQQFKSEFSKTFNGPIDMRPISHNNNKIQYKELKGSIDDQPISQGNQVNKLVEFDGRKIPDEIYGKEVDKYRERALPEIDNKPMFSGFGYDIGNDNYSGYAPIS